MITQRYKKLVARIPENNDSVTVLRDVWGEILTSNDIVEGLIPWWEVESAVRAEISTKFFRLYLLHDDETIKEDITEYVIINSGTLEKTYQQGQTRSLSISLMNPDKIWNPSPNDGRLWHNTKFKLIMGLKIKSGFYWVDEGVFVCHDPQLTNGDSNRTVTVQLYDKFALLDGTVNGVTDTDFLIPRGTRIDDAITALIRLPKDKLGRPLDNQPIIFPNRIKDTLTSYTIKKTSNNKIGDMIIDLANIVSCDVFYDGAGRLTLREGQLNLNYEQRNIAWNYSNSTFTPEFKDVGLTVEWSKIKNKVVVIGGNSGSGYLYRGTAENVNAASPYNVNSALGVRTSIITDNQIGSSDLCEERARYELKKIAVKYIQIKMKSVYIPHMLPNDLIRWTYEDYDIKNELFLIQSVSIPLDTKEGMDISFTNIRELTM